MKSIREEINLFFSAHEDFLTKSYPGLSAERLLKSFLENYPQLSADVCFSWGLSSFFEKLKNRVPLAYIFGKAFFFADEFLCNQETLIPRFDTEILVEESLKIIASENIQTVLDIGTGTGCVGLSLLTNSQKPLCLVATDLSAQALAVAQKNANLLKYRLHPAAQLSFLQMDRLRKWDYTRKLDLIVSNPPYIPQSEFDSLVQKEVHDYEPHMALYLEDGQYQIWFENLFDQVFSSLRREGFFLMEIHERKTQVLLRLLKDQGFQSIRIVKDLNGRDRVIIAQR